MRQKSKREVRVQAIFPGINKTTDRVMLKENPALILNFIIKLKRKDEKRSYQFHAATIRKSHIATWSITG